ncbi:MAG: metalloregulator ArsR/SmtB family transcription factor [Micrococcaceae bacterium]
MEQKIDVAAVLKSLADDTRLDIIRKLARDKNEVTSNEIISGCGNALNLSQPTMSHHFNKLVSAKVVTARKQGATKYYQLNNELLESIGIDATKL